MAGGHGEKMTRKRELLISNLLTSPTIAQAAQAAGVSEATAGRWLKDAAFQARYQAVRRQVLERSMTILQQGMLGAVATRRSVMLAGDTPPSAKIQAAKIIIETALRSVEVETLEQRLVALEAALARQELDDAEHT